MPFPLNQTDMESIGLFGAASDRLEASYYDLAGAFGRLVGERGLTLVYGGADSGLMESAARGVKDAGGHVVGIVPSVLEARRRVSRYVDEVVPCHDLSDRKAIMVERSDVLVALPGGIGTLDEVFTVMAANSIGYHRKKVVLFALDGFWDGLVEVLQEMDRRGFVNVPLEQYLVVARSWDELQAVLAQFSRSSRYGGKRPDWLSVKVSDSTL